MRIPDLSTNKSTSKRYASTRPCPTCKGEKSTNCALCMNGYMPISVDVDRLLLFLRYSVQRNEQLLVDSELSLPAYVREEIIGQNQAYEEIIATLYANSLS